MTLIFSAFLFLFISSAASAQMQFTVSSNVIYNVQDSGVTSVVNQITLQNNLSEFYATTYTVSLQNIDAENIRAQSDSGTTLPTDIQKDGDTTNVKITFPDAVVGKGATRHFTITYDNTGFAVRTGEVWEVTIPRLSDAGNFQDYNVTLNIPPIFGLEAYISPQPATSQSADSGRTYTFTKSEVTQSEITAGFGQFQVFSFNLTYHLENTSQIASESQIALPPDTAYQRVYIQRLTPQPENVTIDKDGNWIATYRLSARQRVDINAIGAVQIFASYRSFPKPNNEILNDDLKPTEYWQVNDPQIQALAQKLKTPRAIYDYVSTTLKYDFSRVQPNVQRMGAVAALENPTQAICMEFTDLFIAIARAAGIPAREINGYAYTENPSLEPLSLVNDVLHAWPEYYDAQKGAWIPIDPTWASTSGGVDYFNKLDLRHFTFVIHGESSTEPYPPGSYKLGTNPQKDVFVSFGKLPENRFSIPQISIIPTRTLPFLSSIYTARIYNPGPSALYSIFPTTYFDSTERSRDFIQILPPYSNYEWPVTVPFSLLGKNTPNVIKVSIEGVSAETSTNKNQVVVNSLIVVLIFLLIIMLAVLILLKKITFAPLFVKITSVFRKKPINNDGTNQIPPENSSGPQTLS